MISKRTAQKLQIDYYSFSECSDKAREELIFIEKMIVNMALHDYDNYDYVIQPRDVETRKEIYDALVSLGYFVNLYPCKEETCNCPTDEEFAQATEIAIGW